MANQKISSLTAASTIDATNDYLAIAQSAISKKINRNTLLGLTSAPVGKDDVQTLTNKTLTSPTINSATFSGTLSGTYTIGGTPTFPSSVVTLTGSQTLTNKVLTAPTINNGSITGTTITTDAIVGQSASTSGTIYGASIASGVIASAALLNSVNTAAIQNTAVTANKLATGASSATVVTTQTTTSTSYVDLATSGPAVTVTIGANGLALVAVSAELSNSGANYTQMGFALSGTNTVAASDAQCLANQTANFFQFSNVYLLTGLNSGSTTFTAKYKVAAGTGTFLQRALAVVPL